MSCSHKQMIIYLLYTYLVGILEIKVNRLTFFGLKYTCIFVAFNLSTKYFYFTLVMHEEVAQSSGLEGNV